MLLKPIAKTLIRHELAELTKLRVKWLSIHSDVMHHQVGDWMVARFAVHARFSPNETELSHRSRSEAAQRLRIH